MVAHMVCLFFSLKIANSLKQTFFKDSKTTKIKLNHQKVPVPSNVLLKNSSGTDGTFFKQVFLPCYFHKVLCPPLL